MVRTWAAAVITAGLAGVVGCAGTARPMCFHRNHTEVPCPVEHAVVPSGEGPILADGLPGTTVPLTAGPVTTIPPTFEPPTGATVIPPGATAVPPATTPPPPPPPVGPQPRTVPPPGTSSTKSTK